MKKEICLALLTCGTALSLTAQETESSLLPKSGDRYVSFGINGQNGTFYYRKYGEKGFIQAGIGGRMAFTSTPENRYNSAFNVYPGTSHKFSALDVTPQVTFGHAARLSISNRLETFAGINYHLGLRFLSINEKLTITDETLLENTNYYGFTNGDYQSNQIKEISLNASVSPFVGFNYFLTEKLAVGAFYSFTGFSVTAPIERTETFERVFQGLEPKGYSFVLEPGVMANLEFTGSGGVMISYSLR